MTRIWLLPVVFLFSVAAVFASETVRKPASVDLGHTGCPVVTAEGVISQVNAERGAITFLTKGEKVALQVGEKTKYRIPGVSKSELKLAPLAKVPVDAPAKIKFCATDGQVLEVKVLKSKKTAT